MINYYPNKQYNKIQRLKDYYQEFYTTMTQDEKKDIIKLLKNLGVIKINQQNINLYLKKNVIIETNILNTEVIA